MSIQSELADHISILLSEFGDMAKKNKNFSVRLRGLLSSHKYRRVDIMEDLVNLSKEVVESTADFSLTVVKVSNHLKETLAKRAQR